MEMLESQGNKKNTSFQKTLPILEGGFLMCILLFSIGKSFKSWLFGGHLCLIHLQNCQKLEMPKLALKPGCDWLVANEYFWRRPTLMVVTIEGNPGRSDLPSYLLVAKDHFGCLGLS